MLIVTYLSTFEFFVDVILFCDKKGSFLKKFVSLASGSL